MLRKIAADPDDGSTISQAGWPDTGSEDYRKVARQGKNVRVNPQRDPVVGDRLTLGMTAFGENPNNGRGGGPNSTVTHSQGFTRHKKDDGFAMPTGGHVLVTASWRSSRYFYKYTDEYGYLDDDSHEIFAYDWTAPLGSQAWLDIENARINYFPDNSVYRVMLDRSVPNDVTREGNLQEVGAEKFLLGVKNALAAERDAQYAHFMFSQTEQFPRSRYWTYHIVSSSNTTVPERFKPYVILRTMKTHALNTVGGASIQMTDGTAVFLRKVGEAINLYYQRIEQQTPTLIKKLPTTASENSTFYKADGEAFQAFSLARDSSNNIFVVGMDGRDQPEDGVAYRPFLMNGFKYNGNYSWTYWTPTTGGENQLNYKHTSRGMPNNFQALWIPASEYGDAGQFAVVYSHRDSQWSNYQLGIYTMYAGWLIGDASPGKRASTGFVAPYSTQSYWRPMNSVGTGLDAALVGSSEVQFCSFCSASSNDENERHGAGSVHIYDDHRMSTPSLTQSSWIDSPHDPDGKARQVWMGESPDHTAYMRNGRLSVRRISNGSLYRDIDFTTLGLTNFPSTAQLQRSQAWDVIYDTLRNRFWIYYMDSQNNRHIRKVGYDPYGNVLDQSYQLTESNKPLGESGTRIVALRAPRQDLDPRCVLIDVAMVNQVGVPQTLISLRDLTMNRAPGPPVMYSVPAFNAANLKYINYEFNDPGDTASAQEIQIRRVSNGAMALESGKVAAPMNSSGQNFYGIQPNRLSNDTAYQIRIRNYDAVGQLGEWSEWVAFSTSGTGGTVTLTQPPADLAPLNSSSVLVAWTYENTDPSKTQKGYQIRVYNDSNNALVSDTGIIAGTATSRTLTGFTSDVRYRIEVSVQDTSNGLSGAGIRYIFPDFNNPPTPIVDAMPGNGYIEVRVTNPAPSGENPVAVSNQIARSENGEEFLVIGECELNGVFRDYTVASEVEYTYKARGATA